MDKPWLMHYPPGVPASIDPHPFGSVVELLERSCERFADLPALENMGVSLRYRELDQLSRAFAAFLQHDPRLSRGDRIALMLPNVLQYHVALLGVLRAGFTVVNVNPMYTPRELEHQLRDSGATAIVVLENFAHTLEQVLERTSIKLVITTEVGDLMPGAKGWLVNGTIKYVKRMVPRWRIPGTVSLRKALERGRRANYVRPRLTHDDIAFLQYTGGTTGVAKGVVLSHGNMIANVLQLGAWVAPALREGGETAVIPLPLYHVYALMASLLFLTIGSRCVLITNPRDLSSFVATLKNLQMTAIIGVNTLFAALVDAPGFAEVDMRKLKLCAAGGMAVQRVVAQKWKAITGAPLVEGYGLSETSPVVTSNRLDIRDWTGFIGLPLPSTEAAILDEHGEPMAVGEIGEVCVRGPQVMQGYWNKPEETRQVFTKDGWFRTGDMGVMDGRGYFQITDRKKDMIVVSGFKVFPNEVEDVIMMHPDVLEAGAIGVPDARSGEAVKVFVVRRSVTLTVEALLEHCRKHLTPYKLPKHVEFRVEPLPKTQIGKVQRRALRADPAQQHASVA